MTLVRWTPISTLVGSPHHPATAARRWVPQLDLVEAEDHYLVRADLPGLSQDDVSIEIDDRVLTISGERAATTSTDETRAIRVERVGGSFRRAVTLPEGVDAEAVTATFAHGVLEVSVPKPVARTPHRVAIAAAA